jgi:hypothetical protein
MNLKPPSKPPRPKAIRIRKKEILEKDVEGPVKEYAKDLGFWVRKFVSPAHRSVPDDIFTAPGPPGATMEELVATLHKRTFFVEFKRPGEPATESQEREHVRMRAYGHAIYVIDNEAAGKALIDLMRMPL